MATGGSDGAKCETTSCGADEACCNGGCIPVGVPTESLCPQSFEVDPLLIILPNVTLVFDRSELDQELFKLSCFYTSEDGSSIGFIRFQYRPADVNSTGDGSCGIVDGNGDNIIELDYFDSTTRTISVFANAGSPIVDHATLLRELVTDAVAAGVGSDCCLGG